MGTKLIILLASLIAQKSSGEEIDLTFPDGFMIGTATSAYQVEGAWNNSDKGESVWDHFVHQYPDKIENRSNGDVACDSFNKYKEDVQMLRELGVDHYRFSLSWSRLLPTGYPDKASESGVRYYHDLLSELEKYNITPIVTLYHYDHPQSLEKFGGWLNESMAYAFADYARFVFREFGPRVKYFVTINEIFVECTLGYGRGIHAPGIKMPGVADYICAHNNLKAHALAYHLYDQEFRKTQNGSVGFTEALIGIVNKDANDTETEDAAFAFLNGWLLNPVFSAKGNYPEIMIRKIAEKSKLEGLEESRLPAFSEDWIDRIRGSADFLGLNSYMSFLVGKSGEENPLNMFSDTGLNFSFDPTWPTTQFHFNKIAPTGFGNLLRKIRDEYNNPPVYILENGVAVSGGLNDTMREEYMYLYLKETLTAIKRDKCNVKMYTYWSLLDNFEWSFGYNMQFGLVHVDFNSNNRTRTLKNSGHWFKSVIKARKLERPASLKSDA